MTSHGNKREAFTLVELLIVITIIGMLAGLLIPAVNFAREAARRAQCINHQRNLAMAMITHDTTDGALPGSLNQLGRYKATWTDHRSILVEDPQTAGNPAPRVFSWVVALLPYIEENVRYEILMADNPNAGDPTTNLGLKVGQAIGRIPVLFCTSARLDSFTSTNDPRLSYVVNCGPEAASGLASTNVAITGNTALAQTVFRDRRGHEPLWSVGSNASHTLLSKINKKVKLEDIHDGASNTVLLSENVHAWTWYLANSAHTGTTNSWDGGDELNYTIAANDIIPIRSSAATACFGFVWSNRQTVPGTYNFLSKINDGFSDTPSTMPNTAYARPSAMHPGLVVMAYADGTARAMNDDVGRGPYLKAVCPNDVLAEGLVSNGGLDYGNPVFQQTSW